MGLISGSGYTGAMAPPDPKRLESADLSIIPDRGEIRNARGESARLGPVNMKVLGFLMSRAGRVVSRADLFEAVWKNQVVGDDALTRSISDIRAEIGRLSDRENLIETLPKRGYRWTAEVREASREHVSGAPLLRRTDPSTYHPSLAPFHRLFAADATGPCEVPLRRNVRLGAEPLEL